MNREGGSWDWGGMHMVSERAEWDASLGLCVWMAS